VAARRAAAAFRAQIKWLIRENHARGAGWLWRTGTSKTPWHLAQDYSANVGLKPVVAGHSWANTPQLTGKAGTTKVNEAVEERKCPAHKVHAYTKKAQESFTPARGFR